MSTDYIPQKDTLTAAWAANFSGLITATPGAYGLMASDAATIATSYTLFNTALNLVLNPATKTRATVADKNAKKLAMLATLRQYAQVIKRNLGVTNEAKVALGLTIDDTGRAPVPAPTTLPVLNVVNTVPLRQAVDFRDITTPDRRAKPAGVKAMMLVQAIGTTPPADPGALPTYALATKQPYVVAFNPGDRGKNAYYFGRWITAAGLTGPWSAMAELIIA